MPYGEIQKQGGRALLSQGIIKDWQEALAGELGYQVKTVALPKNRIVKLDYNQFYDLQCFIAPEWLGDSAKNLNWPPAFDHIEERLVGPKGTNLITSGQQLSGKQIGTVLGYFYPKLAPYFNKTPGMRDDASTEELLLKKQLAGRVDYSVMRVIDLRYLQTINPETKSLELSSWVITDTSVYCAHSRSSPISFDSIVKAQDRLLKQGRYQQILKKYLK